MIEPSAFRFFLDSGAYGAWSRGAQIDIDEYCAFIRANIDHIEVYANLDHIAGEPGRDSSPAEKEEGAAKSWANFEYMRSEGLDPLPVFHAGEQWKWLDKMLAAGCGYIGLGGLVGLDVGGRRRWLDEVFLRLTNERGEPIVKTHGFGMTAIPLIFRYPWHSVDSSTWLRQAANGSIYLPALHEGEFVFDRVPTTISVSSRDPAAYGFMVSPSYCEILDRWLAQCGTNREQVSTHYYYRALCNVIFFKKVSALKASRPFQRNAIRRGKLL